MKIFIIGLGLIGGSIAKALKKNADAIIYAFDTNEHTINAALSDHVIDYGYTDIYDKKFNCDIVIVATPPSIVVDTIKKFVPHFNNDAVFSDVCSIKGGIVDRISELDCHFVGGHPMAGTENSGYEYAKADMFQNAHYILTKENEKLAQMIVMIGAKKIIIPVDVHDYLVGVISHIPHVVSAGLVNLAADNNEGDILYKLAGGGFRDITRISSSSEYMWQQILFSNKDNMLKLLTDYEAIIRKFRTDLENNHLDEIIQYFRRAREQRGKF